jgi:dipeptidyl aminopeptidase/acylaminoacyl peptidase
MEARLTADLFVLEVDSGAVRKLVDTPGPDTNPRWSPDGTQIAYQTYNGSLAFESNIYIAVVPAAGGAPRLVSTQVDEWPDMVAWTPQGIYFNRLEKTDRHLWRLDPNTGGAKRVTVGTLRAYRGYSFTSDYRRMAYIMVSNTARSELFVTDVQRFKPKQLTAFTDQYKGVREPSREVTSWKSSDGVTVEGVLIKPADFDPRRKYPLLVVMHGGPTDIDLPIQRFNYAYPLETFAAKGALILQPNYRGSTGYGEKFRTPDPHDLKDYEDLVSGINHLIAQGNVEKDRVGAMGWSQGGYLAALLGTRGTDMMRAVSVGAGVPNWFTYYANSDVGYTAPHSFWAKPKDDPEVYKMRSPMTYVAGAKTPTLIQHGEFDNVAPLAGANELFRTLADQGVPVKMIIYKGAGHGVGTPKGQVALQEHNYEWFSRWIWGERSQ